MTPPDHDSDAASVLAVHLSHSSRLSTCRDWIGEIQSTNNETRSELYRFAVSLVGKLRLNSTANDLLQELSAKFWAASARAPSLQGEKAPEEWAKIACKTLANIANNQLRKKVFPGEKRKHLLREVNGFENLPVAPQSLETTPCPFDAAEAAETIQLVRKAIEQLSAEEAAVIYFREVEEKSRREVSELTGLTPDQIRDREKNAKEHLQKALQDYMNGE